MPRLHRTVRATPRAPAFALAALLAPGLLVGCPRADSPTVSAASTEPAALMQAVFPGWQMEGPAASRTIVSPPGRTPDGKPAPAEEDTYKLSPALVIPLAANRAVLIVAGEPADPQGNSRAGHSSPALLAAYWFEQRAGGWTKVAEQPDFAQEGFFGNPGKLRRLDLGGGAVGLAVENGSCWQGNCGQFLGLYRVGDTRIDKVFGDLLSSDSEGATESCSDLLKLQAGQSRHLSQEEYSTAYGCYRIEGRWRIQAAPQDAPQDPGPAHLVIEYTGKESAAQTVPRPPRNPEGQASEGEESRDGADEAYLVTIRPVRQKQTYRFANGRYELTQGRNPNPGL